jgi:hypothetical protein
MSTLQYFGVLVKGDKLGQYRYARQLAVSQSVSTHCLGMVWQAHPTPQIDLDEFGVDPALTFLDRDEFAALWRSYQPALWVLEERIGGRRVTLKYVEAERFGQASVDLA